jgi:hypothetical protein
MPSECVECVSHPIITVRENGRRASFNNPANDSYQKVHVDGCLIKNGIRCDWIVRQEGIGAVAIELKGADVAHACRQLHETSRHPAAQPYVGPRLAFLVVSSRSPSFDTRVARAKEEARRRGIRLTVRTREHVCNIQSLF